MLLGRACLPTTSPHGAVVVLAARDGPSRGIGTFYEPRHTVSACVVGGAPREGALRQAPMLHSSGSLDWVWSLDCEFRAVAVRRPHRRLTLRVKFCLVQLSTTVQATARERELVRVQAARYRLLRST